MNVIPLLLPELLLAAGAAVSDGHVALRAQAIEAVIAQNDPYGEVHKAGYNGMAELRAVGGENLFVPTYAGLNYEHIFSGDAASYGWDKMEPRTAAMSLRRVSPRRVELRQERTQHWPLRTTISYQIVGRDAIDFTVEAVPLEDAWRKLGYIGLFFASYINAPEDKAIRFIARARPGAGDPEPRWVSHVPPRHGEAACHRAAGADWDPAVDAGFTMTLASAHSALEYVYPFYYGISHGKALVMMFDRPSKDGETRFAQSPSGGGPGNPAWDFIFLQRHYNVGRPFRFRARAVYRDFTGEEDVIRAYETWAKVRVKRPARS